MNKISTRNYDAQLVKIKSVLDKLEDNFDYDQNLKTTTPFWFITMFEILFSRKIMYFKIDSQVYDIFIKERRLQYLIDKNNLYYQIQLILYNYLIYLQ